MVRFWRSLGVRAWLYINDFLVVASNRNKALWLRNHVVRPTLNALGWVQEVTKGTWEPAQEVTVLGLRVNAAVGKFYIESEKLSKYVQLCQQTRKRKWVRRRELAAVAGKLQYGIKAAPVVKVMLQPLHRSITPGPWNGWVQLLPEAKRDLAWLACNLAKVNGSPLWRKGKVLRLVTDAAGKSTMGWGAQLAGVQARGDWTVQQMDWPIHLKELWAVLMGLRSFAQEITCKRVQLYTDSQVVAGIMQNTPHTAAAAEIKRQIKLTIVKAKAVWEEECGSQQQACRE